MKDSFILSGDELEQWVNRHILPKGFESFDKDVYCDTETGDFDSEKGAMTDYEVSVRDKDKNWWMAKDIGYYTGPTGHIFNESKIKFELYVPEKYQ